MALSIAEVQAGAEAYFAWLDDPDEQTKPNRIANLVGAVLAAGYRQRDIKLKVELD